MDFHSSQKESRNPEAAFALSALMEVPVQYQAILSLGILHTASPGICTSLGILHTASPGTCTNLGILHTASLGTVPA